MNNSINGVDLTDSKYTVKQKAIRNAYKVYNSKDEEVLRTKQKLFKMKEEFPFTDPEGNELFNIKAENIMDIAGDYAITDSKTCEKVAVLKKEFSILVHKWEIEDGEGNLIAKIESRGKLFGILRGLSNLFNLLPHTYTVKNSDGRQIGTINQSFTLIKDKYGVEINKDVENREALIAASITIDALEGN